VETGELHVCRQNAAECTKLHVKLFFRGIPEHCPESEGKDGWKGEVQNGRGERRSIGGEGSKGRRGKANWSWGGKGTTEFSYSRRNLGYAAVDCDCCSS